MKQNSPEDTAWLKLETYDFLNAAIIWPKTMVKIFNVFALVCLVLLSYAVISADYLLSFASLTVLGWISYKLYYFYADIILVNNELNRRAREKTLLSDK